VTDTVTVQRPLNDYDAMTVETVDTHSTRQIVEIDSPGLRQLLGRIPADAECRVEMERLPGRGNCWRVTRLVDEPPSVLAQVDPVRESVSDVGRRRSPDTGMTREPSNGGESDLVDRTCDRLVH
jgi:hypothetical protein